MTENRKIALVTGGNQGIGYEICRQLGAAGVHVLVGARDPARGAEAARKLAAAGADAASIRMDVTDPGEVAKAAESVAQRYGRLDILVNNAGVLLPEDRPSGSGAELVRQVYETNVFGVVRVTKAMLPLLRKSTGGRIVNMSSSLASLQLHGDPSFELGAFLMLGYNSSKTAVNALTVMWAKELAESGIKVNAADPGYCATAMTGYASPRTPAEGARAPVRLALLPDDGPSGGFFGEDGPIPW
ncbi:SDR family oxidoreductase [Cohnella sp. JJ-181]|uniref:SDR family oxidoreductase n=1 Tax=Cohnella rhizoplanae TaxID=2974897 RepID=UPI0022FF89B3|nr:SDR family oxidoreductase [Cohnella sp. JJ-181]CAI6087438.1 Putative ketoacyl reductase [Cohnella sp. JJ-181]